jgi:hypothetical protein
MLNTILITTEGVKKEKKSKESKKKNDRRIFKIITPLRIYFVRARHEPAMNDWVESIQKLRSVAKVYQTKPQANNVGEPVHGDITLVYQYGQSTFW